MAEIIKRDGRSLPFNREKIVNAVLAAFNEVDGEITDYARSKANHIAEYIESVSEEKQLTIEDIQDLVEHGLMSTKRKDVARAYIVYREKRDLDRKRNSRLMQDVSKKLMATDTKNWNANLDEKSFGGRMGEANSVITKAVALDDIISEKSKFNHINNRIYIHDLNSYAVGMHNCLSLPMDKLLQNGFKTRQCNIRPANGVATACQLSAVIAQLQSLDQFGGVSATHIDWTMVPFIRKSFYRHWKDGCKYIERVQPEDLMNVEKWSIEDAVYKHYPKAYEYAMDMTTREVYQGVEALYHNLNTLQSRSGNQLPFTSINYGTCTLPEGRMFIRALLEKSIEGTGPHGDTSIFPCGIFQSSKEWNRYPGTPNYDLYQLALKSTSIRLYPNYANIDWSNNAGYDPSDPETYFSTMGKRKLQLMKNLLNVA